MIVRRENDRLLVDAPAKVNLHLEVLGKRPDGYHELETLMVTVSLYDTLTIKPVPEGTVLSCSDPNLAMGTDNLVTRAVELARREGGCDQGLSVELTKRIPAAAGLAGGSSDAAATLAGLSLLWDLNWSRDRMAELGAQLGSDVPFFFHAPAAIAKGRGERLTPVLLGTRLHLVLVCPDEGLSTARIFADLNPPTEPKSIRPIVEALEDGQLSRLGALLFNRLEEVAVRHSPAVRELAQEAPNWDCAGSVMSGSGSAYLALCSSYEQAETLRQQLVSKKSVSVFVVKSSH